jgi:hypothetical protein
VASFAICIAGLLVLAGACSAGDIPTSTSSSPSGGEAPTTSNAASAGRGQARAGRVSIPFDVNALVDSVRFAFQQEGDSYRGSTATHAVEIEAGRIRFSPLTAAEGSDEGAAAPVAAAPISFETRAIMRVHGDAFDVAQRSATRTQDGSLDIDRGVAMENLTLSEAGLEQSWHFDDKPEGSGDLLVSVSSDGYEYVEQTELGHSFRDPESGAKILYGLAYWVDATGTRSEVPVTYAGGQLELRVGRWLVEHSEYPAVLDPTIGPEKAATGALTTASGTDDRFPDVAYDGVTNMVVWSDGRSGTYQIYAARLQTTGGVPDNRGIRIGNGSGIQTEPSIAYNGTDYLVVWQDARNGNNDIFGARVTPAGAVLGEFAISTAAGEQTKPTIAANGATWLVTWEDAQTGAGEVRAARVDSGGSVLDAGGIVVATGATSIRVPAVACDGTQCLVAWNQGGGQGDVLGSLVNVATGTPGTAFTIISQPSDQTQPSIAFDGSNYLVAWSDRRQGSQYDVWAGRVTTAGVVLDVDGVQLVSAAGAQRLPSVSFNGTEFLVAWHDDAGDGFAARGVRVSSAAALVGSVFTINDAANDQRFVAVANQGTRWVAVWEDDHTNDSALRDAYAARIGPTGSVLDPNGIVISRSANRQTLASAASDGTRYLIVWSDGRGPLGEFEIWGALVDATGVVRRQKAVSAAPGSQFTPAIAYDAANSQFFVAWNDQRDGADDIYGARVTVTSTDFTVLDPNGILINASTDKQRRASVAIGSSNYLVAWQDDRAGNSDIYAQRVSAAGALVGMEIPLSTTTFEASNPSVATDGTDFFVAWDEARNGNDSEDVFGRQVGADGTAGGEVTISAAANAQTRPELTFGLGQYFVVWGDSRADALSSDLFGVPVSTLGVVGTEQSFAAGADSETRPDIVTVGSLYFVVWHQTPLGGQSDAWGARLSSTGTLAEPAFSLGATSTGEDSARAAVLGDRVMVSYSRFIPGSPFDAERVNYRLVTFDGAPSATPCVSGSECDSGFCADGFCCDQACNSGCGACSIAAGSTQDGICSPLGGTCRPAVGNCDAAEVCDGASVTCPANAFLTGTVCRAPKYPCQEPALCTGTSAFCTTANPLSPAGTVCRVNPGYKCAGDSVCDGVSTGCPPYPPLPAGTECRPEVSACDPADLCDGVDINCPRIDNCP